MKFLLTSLFVLSLIPHFAQANLEGEVVPASEVSDTREIVNMIRSAVEEGFRKDGRAHRDAHRKHHGCVTAEFDVLENIPVALKHGLFSHAKSYDAWIRFSNGSGASQDDREGDGRGFAIKVIGVEGDKLSRDEEKSQDFLMINHPVFFVRHAGEYVKFQKHVMAGNPLFFFGHPMRIFHELRIANAIRSKEVANPLASRYWSMVPSKLGDSAMKFSVEPCQGAEFARVPESPEQLRESLEKQLMTGSACFDFKIQLRTQPKNMPIEDATIEWSEAAAPFVAVARISINSQQPLQGESCETMSFNPWHSLVEHRPLGGISRVRKIVYEEVARTRLGLNKQDRNEPK